MAADGSGDPTVPDAAQDALAPDAGSRAAIDLLDHWTPMALRVAITNGLIEELGPGPRTAADVAVAAGTDPGITARVLRALAGRGVIHERQDGALELTELGRRFLADEPGSIGRIAGWRPWEMHAWAELEHTLRTGRPAFEVAFPGRPYFEWLAEHPAESARFDRTMEDRTRRLIADARPLLERLPATGRVVDVGGGNGTLLAAVLTARPGLRGVVLDLPHVVAGAPAILEAAGVADRAEAVGGSFFDPLPAGADAYLLASVLHDWPDDRAAAILARVREAIPEHGRLVILDAVLRGPNAWDNFKLIDLHMAVLFGAGERDEPAWRALLERTGFALDAILPLPGLGWLEARPA